ncbi:MAG TPA: hypothetical protein VH834_15405 [Solirubrobacteraceae bacterium]
MTDDDEQGPPGFDWASAAVDDGELTVPVLGTPPRGWVTALQHVIDRLQRTGHGVAKVKVTKKQVTVGEVSPGGESEVHHFLESALLQVNADLSAAEEAESEGERSESDQQMTDAFRSFGD